MFKRNFKTVIIVAFVVLFLSGCASSFKSEPWEFEKNTNAPVYIDYDISNR